MRSLRTSGMSRWTGVVLLASLWAVSATAHDRPKTDLATDAASQSAVLNPVSGAQDGAAPQAGAAEEAAEQPAATQTADAKLGSVQQQTPTFSETLTLDDVVGRVFYREAELVESMKKYSPMVETYIQNLKTDSDMVKVPVSDAYFLGRLVLNEKGINDKSYIRPRSVPSRVTERINNFYRMKYLPMGFMQLIFLDQAFDANNYKLKYLRRQFLGEVRTIVFDVTPKKKFKVPHFLGRIWVEDQDYTIVRINGTYTPSSRMSHYFHFDSWRVNVRPGMWLPAYVYTEESDTSFAFLRKLAMKGQTRLWGYDLKHAGRQEEFTSVLVDAPTVNDQTQRADNEISPVGSLHMWEREAEDNVLERLERSGLLAPQGDVSKVLETVVNNLLVTNNLDLPDVRCRVLLTTPLESFTVGRTIIVSRGLLDVLPDESSLAMVLAHEVGHIALGHPLDTKFAFLDRMLFPDEETFRRLPLARDEHAEEAADKRGLEILQNSPYKDKLGTAALFLHALQDRSKELPYLVSPHFGNRLAKGNSALRMAALLQSMPELQARDPKQLAALPLGTRIKLDPWDDHIEMQKAKPLPVEYVRDKLSFEVTPTFPNLARYKGEEVATTAKQATESAK